MFFKKTFFSLLYDIFRSFEKDANRHTDSDHAWSTRGQFFCPELRTRWRG